MLLAHLLWDALHPGEPATEEHWEYVLARVEAFVRDEFEASWGALASVERGMVEAVASADAGLPARSTFARFGLTKGGAPPAASRLDAAGILAVDRSWATGYRLVDPLFARWVAAGRRWA